MQGMFVIGHAVEFEGQIQCNGLWPGAGGGRLEPQDCLKLLACTDYSVSGSFFVGAAGRPVEAMPKPASPFVGSRGHPMTRFAGMETWIMDAAASWLNESSER